MTVGSLFYKYAIPKMGDIVTRAIAGRIDFYFLIKILFTLIVSIIGIGSLYSLHHILIDIMGYIVGVRADILRLEQITRDLAAMIVNLRDTMSYGFMAQGSANHLQQMHMAYNIQLLQDVLTVFSRVYPNVNVFDVGDLVNGSLAGAAGSIPFGSILADLSHPTNAGLLMIDSQDIVNRFVRNVDAWANNPAFNQFSNLSNVGLSGTMSLACHLNNFIPRFNTDLLDILTNLPNLRNNLDPRIFVDVSSNITNELFRTIIENRNSSIINQNNIIKNSEILSNLELLKNNKELAKGLLNTSDKSLVGNIFKEFYYGLLPPLVAIAFSVSGVAVGGYFAVRMGKEVVKHILID